MIRPVVPRACRLCGDDRARLRTRLLLSEPLQNAQVIAVTSGAAKEGKTSLAVQLAMSISRALKEVVLIVDGDMRSPDIHHLLDLPLSPGLAETLAGEAQVDDAISSQWDEQLHVLPAHCGSTRTSSSAAASGHRCWTSSALATATSLWIRPRHLWPANRSF